MHSPGKRSVFAVALLVGCVSRDALATVTVERAAGTESCPDEPAFIEMLNSNREDIARLDRKDLRVRFERTSNGYRSRVHMANGTQRSLSDDAATCTGLADATALAIKLALDLEDDVEPTPLSNAPTEQQPSAAPPVAERAPSMPPPSSNETSHVAELSTGGVVVVGLATPVAMGVRASAALVLTKDRWSVGLTAMALPAQTIDVGDGTVNISLLGGGLEACGRMPIRRTLGAALCARVEALRMHGRAQGFARSQTDSRPLFTTALLARGYGRISAPVALFVEVGAVAPIVRERFAIDTVGPVYDPPVVGGSAGIGVLIDFD